MTCERAARSSLLIWALTRASASSRPRPLRSAVRAAATSGGAIVTQTSSVRSSQPASNSSAASRTAIRAPRVRSSSSFTRIISFIRGCVIAFSRRSCSGSLKTMAPSFLRSMAPSWATIRRPKASTTSRQAGWSGRYTS